MEKTKDRVLNQLIMRILKLLHLTLCTALFSVAWFRFRYHGHINTDDTGFRYNYYVIIAYVVLLLFFLRTYNAYMVGYSRIRMIIFSMVTSQLFSLVAIYFAVSTAWGRFDNPRQFVGAFFVQVLVDITWAFFANRYYSKTNPPKRAVLIYRDSIDKRRFGTLGGKPTKRLFRIVSEIEYDGEYEDIREKLEGHDAIFVAGVNSRCRNGILKYCKETGTPGFFLPHVGDIIMRKAEHIQAFDSPIFMVHRNTANQEFLILKRTFDIAASLLGMVVLSPIMLITAVAIKLCDGGPILYRQTRLTKDGKEFKICKFRSMKNDAERDGVARLSSGINDDRVTPVGRFIRKCRIDELPQLWNILIGDMSIVGPRPERPEIAEQYYAVIPDFKLRLQVKAGLTGYAQVYGKYNTDPYEKLEFDLMYINDMSVITDLRLMFATFKILFSEESTEGIEEDKTNSL